MPTPLRAGILVTRRYPGYKDIPGVQYHYPKKSYQKAIEQLIGAMILLYEPRRGGSSPDAKTGGRSAFTGLAYVEKVWDDPDDPTHAFAGLRHALDFNAPVSISSTSISGNALQTAVLSIEFRVASEIVAKGLSVPFTDIAVEEREGLSDISDLVDLQERPIEQVLRNARIRDASFRYSVVEKAYDGRCALTGIRMTNGRGRAETDAAHIRPVEHNGPDTVRNGIALMKSIHWAFDRGLLSLADDGQILAVENGIDDSVRGLLRPDLQAVLPANIDERPHPAFLNWHRRNIYKGAA